MNRRDILKLSASSLSLLSLPSFVSAKQDSNTALKNKKLVWILLRGGMDGLHTTLPLFDKNLMALRKDLVTPIKSKALPLNRGFALHPELTFLHTLFKRKQLNSMVATATPIRNRSHFAAQDFLESGLVNTDEDSGWLARMLNTLNNNEHKSTTEGLAVARSLPIAMRGSDKAMTWHPSSLSSSSDDLHQRLAQLYENDTALSERLEQALETQELVDTMNEKKQRGKLSDLAKYCAKLMRQVDGPSVAMLEMGGWDTHNSQVNRLNRQFKELNKGVKVLHKELGKQWQDTLFVVTTEFGRTAKINGTGGTDHGTATSMFIGGGALNEMQAKGGKVLGKWPGLAKEKLYEGRDLYPTSNTFDWIAKALKEHWQLTQSEINQIFPNS